MSRKAIGRGGEDPERVLQEMPPMERMTVEELTECLDIIGREEAERVLNGIEFNGYILRAVPIPVNVARWMRYMAACVSDN